VDDVSDERNRCYELLGLAPGASAEELKAAHRDLVKVWHPDRFAHDPRLQQKAQERLKEINEAYELLTSGRPWRRAQPEPAAREVRHEPPPPQRRRARWPSLLLAAAVCGVVFAVAFRTLWTRADAPVRATGRPPATAGEARPPKDAAPPANQQPQGRRRVEVASPGPAAAPGGAESGRDTAAARALPTATVLIDPTTGLLATPSCPVRNRTTYAAGQEPRRLCDAHGKEKPNRAP
jgi:hypothetical protein